MEHPSEGDMGESSSRVVDLGHHDVEELAPIILPDLRLAYSRALLVEDAHRPTHVIAANG